MAVAIVTMRDLPDGRLKIDVDGDPVDMRNLTRAQELLCAVRPLLTTTRTGSGGTLLQRHMPCVGA